MNYIDILNKEIVKEQYNKIDLINPYAFSHGLKHVKNVCNIMERLCDVLKIDGEKRDALLIACALHDLGQVDGRENHGKKSKEFVIREFNQELENNEFYEDILQSIEKHSDINDNDLSLFCILIQFCDKVDFSKDRLENNYREKFRYYCYEDINDVDFIYNDNEFGINIITNNIDNFQEQFLQEKFSNKIIKVVKSLANKLNCSPVIMHNGKKWVDVV